METFETYFNEMALTDFKKIGRWNDPKNRHGYDKASVGILNSDAGVKKLQDTFNKINIADFALYFVKQRGGRQHAETGRVSPEELQQKLGLRYGVDIPANDDAITVVFTNNSAADRTPLTPWTIAHRIERMSDSTERRSKYSGRYFESYNRQYNQLLTNILRDCYGVNNLENYNRSNYSGLGQSNLPIVRNFLESIGRFRSARMKKLNRTNEFNFECFAYYLLNNGRLSFNPFPPALKSSNRKAWGNDTGGVYRLKDPTAAKEYSQELVNLMSNYFDYLIGSHIDTISIM